MKQSVVILLLTLVILALATRGSQASWFKKGKAALHKSDSDCEKYEQSGKHQLKCGQSSNQCRTCCHFDLERLNNRYNDKRYHIQNAHYVASTGQCVCELCRKHIEDFNNAAFF